MKSPAVRPLRAALGALCALTITACAGPGDAREARAADAGARNDGTASVAADSVRPAPSTGPVTDLPPNELGRIPVLEYHLLGDKGSMWMVERERFRQNLQLLYDRGYRPVTLAEVLDKRIDLPAGTSPVVFTFDDASPSQFSYIEQPDGSLKIDPNSALGIWLAFRQQHPEWRNRATFCLLPAAEAGHAFFGDKPKYAGQKKEWRYPKVKFLADSGFELCNHTLWHAQLNKYPDAFVQEQIARAQMAIDSAVPGYRVRTLALPQGLWPKNRALAWKGTWTDPRGKRTVAYSYDAVLEVAGGPARSPHDPQFDPKRIPRVIVFAKQLEHTLDQLDRAKTRYVSDGNPRTIARPAAAIATTPAAVSPPAR